MTVRRPCVEREEGSKHTETDENEREEYVLYLRVDIVHGGYLIDVHCCGTTEIVDAENADDQESRTSHKHQRELHGCIFLLARTPYSDEKVHRDEGYLIEHEHGEHVGADEESVDTS